MYSEVSKVAQKAPPPLEQDHDNDDDDSSWEELSEMEKKKSANDRSLPQRATKPRKTPTATLNRKKRKLPLSATVATAHYETEDHDKNSRPYHIGGSSTFGNKKKPLLRTDGFIDGRSNAQACFEQKVQLLREFQIEHGHLQVPPYLADPNSKYKKLYSFLVDQRILYRRYLQGDKVPLTKERIELLDSLGEWMGPVEEDAWHEMLPQLTEFYENHGHCCIEACREVALSNKALVKFAKMQRYNFRAWTLKQESLATNMAGVAEGPPTDLEGAVATEVATTHDIVDDNGNGEFKASDEENSDRDNDNGDKIGLYTTRSAAKKEKALFDRVAADYNQEKHEILKQFQCPYMESHEERPEMNVRQGTTLFTALWFAGYEMLREHRKNHPNDQILMFGKGRGKWSPLQLWVKAQRQVYAKIQGTALLEQDGPVKRFFNELIDKHHLLLDPKLVKAAKEKVTHEKRIREEEMEQALKQMETPQWKLEVAQQEEAEATEKLQQARIQLREAEAAVNAARGAVKAAEDSLQDARTQISKAQEEITQDLVGKLVNVKSRGVGKRQGRAKVLKVTERRISTLQPMLFFDLEFEETGETEFFIDGGFVSLVETPNDESTPMPALAPRLNAKADDQAEDGFAHV